MLLQFDLKHIHKVNFYPSDNNFTQALLVMLVTNVTNLEPMQVEFYLAGKITQVIDSIPWVRCASGNVLMRMLRKTQHTHFDSKFEDKICW